MILLENEYSLRGRKECRYRILKREGDVVLAEEHCTTAMKKTNDVMNEKTLDGYEVFVVQKYPDRPRPDGKGIIPAKEMPPSDYHWGRYGHSFAGAGKRSAQALVRAEEQFKIELELQKERLANRAKMIESAEVEEVSITKEGLKPTLKNTKIKNNEPTKVRATKTVKKPKKVG